MGDHGGRPDPERDGHRLFLSFASHLTFTYTY